MTMTIMTMTIVVIDGPTYLSYLPFLTIRSTATRSPSQSIHEISVAIFDELEFLVISWKGGNGMDM